MDSDIRVFLLIMRNFQEHFFYRALPGDYSISFNQEKNNKFD